MVRYALIAVCLSGLLLGAQQLDRRDVSRHLADSLTLAEDDWQAAVKVHDQALERLDEAAGADNRGRAKRLRRKAHDHLQQALNRYAQVLDHIAAADTQPGWLHELHTRRGDALAALERHAGALSAYAAALEISPGHLQAIYGQAHAQLALGQTEAVRASFEQLLIEAEVYGEAWVYVDLLVARMRAWASSRRLDTGGLNPARVESFASWVDRQAAYVREAVRWSLLPD